jgi:hypothetical protein
MAHGVDRLGPDHRDDDHILDHEIVHANEERGALDRGQLRLLPEPVSA